MKGTLVSLTIVGLAACGEPQLCDTAEATFEVERRSAVHIVLDLKTAGRHDGYATYEGSWTYTAEPFGPLAVAVVGPGTERREHGVFSGDFQLHARESGHGVAILIQRLDDSDVVLEGEVSAEAEAVDTCSLDLEVVPD